MENHELKILCDTLEQFEKCNFKDDLGHLLQNNIKFIELKHLARHTFSPISFEKDSTNYRFCKICGKYITSVFHR